MQCNRGCLPTEAVLLIVQFRVSCFHTCVFTDAGSRIALQKQLQHASFSKAQSILTCGQLSFAGKPCPVMGAACLRTMKRLSASICLGSHVLLPLAFRFHITSVRAKAQSLTDRRLGQSKQRLVANGSGVIWSTETVRTVCYDKHARQALCCRNNSNCSSSQQDNEECRIPFTETGKSVLLHHRARPANEMVRRISDPATQSLTHRPKAKPLCTSQLLGRGVPPGSSEGKVAGRDSVVNRHQRTATDARSSSCGRAGESCKCLHLRGLRSSVLGGPHHSLGYHEPSSRSA